MIKKTVHIGVLTDDAELVKKLRALAKKEGRSVSKQAEILIRKGLEKA